MADGNPVQNISLVEIMDLACRRAVDIAGKQQTETRSTEAGAIEITTPPESDYDSAIGVALKPLKDRGEQALVERVWELVWTVEKEIDPSQPLPPLGDVLARHEDNLREMANGVDRVFGLEFGNDHSTTMRYYEERDKTPLSQRTIEAEPTPPPPPAPPSADPDKPTYKLYPMLAIAAAAGHKEGLGKKGFSRATPSSEILADSTLQTHIEKIQADYPGLNGNLLTQTCETVIERAQSAGKKRKDFFVNLALSEKEIAHLENNAFSFQNAFPEIEKELNDLSNAVKTKERGQKMAMPTLEGLDPRVYNLPADRDQALAQKRTAEAAANPPAPPTPAPSAPTPSVPPAERVDTPAPEPQQEDSGKWVKRTAAGAAAAAAVVSIGAGIKEQNGQNQNAQNPNEAQQQESRTRFGAGAKFALGAALALGALLIAKPELVGLGGGAGRSR